MASDNCIRIHPMPPLRFVLRDGQRILQQQCVVTERRLGMIEREEVEWIDVPMDSEMLNEARTGAYELRAL